MFLGELYLKLSMFEEAKNEFNRLLERNPENIDYYCKLHEAENLTTDAEKYELTLRYRIKFPRALMPRRMALNYVSGSYIQFLLLKSCNFEEEYFIFYQLLYCLKKTTFFFVGDLFRKEIDEYMRRGFHKGIPPLFVDLKSLYKDKEKIKIIEILLNKYRVSLKTTGCFSSDRKFYMVHFLIGVLGN